MKLAGLTAAVLESGVFFSQFLTAESLTEFSRNWCRCDCDVIEGRVQCHMIQLHVIKMLMVKVEPQNSQCSLDQISGFNSYKRELAFLFCLLHFIFIHL